MLEKLQALEERYIHLEGLLSNPEAMNDMATWQKNTKTHAKLTEIVTKYREYKACLKTIEDTLELLRELKGRGIATALDTCGLCAWETLESLLPQN